jgi:carbonic anhydrase/acetyltransferase-like protein (isoleucine patch superfamily)
MFSGLILVALIDIILLSVTSCLILIKQEYHRNVNMKIENGQNGSIISYNGISPRIHPSVFICEGVRIIGDVEIGADSSIWFNSVIRGDVHYIRIGQRTNIQDLCMLHVTNGVFPLVIGNDVVIGHSVTLHGATIHDRCMIGIGASVLDGSSVGSYSIVAAGAVVREGFSVPDGVLVAGVPARIVRPVTAQERARIDSGSANYLKYVNDYRKQLIKS